MYFQKQFLVSIILTLVFSAACSPSSEPGDVQPQEIVSSDSSPTTTVVDSSNTLIEEDEPVIDHLQAENLRPKYPLPLELKYSAEIENQEREPYELLQITHLFPLGWSQEGQFAFLEYSTTYHNGYLLEYKLFDVEKEALQLLGSRVYSVQAEDAEFPWEIDPDTIIVSSEELSEEQIFTLVWAATETDIIKKLKDNDIRYESFDNFTSQENDLGRSFDISQETEAEYEDSYYLNDGKHKKLILKSSPPEVKMIKFSGIVKSPETEHFIIISAKVGQFFEMTDEVVPLLLKP